jgi:long-chain acyl-CoA synthetase
MMTPLETLLRAAETRPNHIAFIADGTIWSYRRFAMEIERTARAMAARGVGPGDRVVLHMANVPEMAIACYACFRIGAIAAPLNNRFKTVELQSLMERLQPALYVGQAHLYSQAAPVEPEILPAKARFVVGGAAGDDGARSWDSLFDHGDEALEPYHPATDAPALLLTTSGTTGQPKFVAHTPATLTAIAGGAVQFGLEPDDVVINSCPMVHASGMITFLAAIHQGAPMVLLERFDADAVLDAIEAYRGSWVLGLPFMFAAMLDRQRAHRREMGSLRLCVTGGDVCPPTLQLEFPFAFGRALHSFWAMTETAGTLAFGLRPGSVTRIPSGAEIRLVDDEGEAVPHGAAGELLIRGPNVSVGYWAGPGRVDPCGAGGWLATGDIMRQGEGDELWFVSRKKDLIIRGGSNISPAEVEQVLKTHPSVREVAVIGVPDPKLGQRVAALVELAANADSGVLDDILARARPQLADYKLPERLQTVREIPKNGLGKIDRKSLPALLAAS